MISGFKNGNYIERTLIDYYISIGHGNWLYIVIIIFSIDSPTPKPKTNFFVERRREEDLREKKLFFNSLILEEGERLYCCL